MARRLAIMALVTVWLVSTELHAQASGAPPTWSGELTLSIRGDGAVNAKPIAASWSVNRTAKAHVLLQRMFRGAGLTRTENSSDTARYETWVADVAQPATIEVNDQGSFDGPFFDPRNFRLDTIRWTCPAAGAPANAGQIRASILQFDYQKGTATWEAPRIFTHCEKFYRLEFHKGTPEWTAKPPVLNEQGVDRGFEVIHRLVVPDVWTRITVPFSAGQTEITLSRKLTFEWPLRTEMHRAPLQGELVLVLRKSP